MQGEPALVISTLQDARNLALRFGPGGKWELNPFFFLWFPSLGLTIHGVPECCLQQQLLWSSVILAVLRKLQEKPNGTFCLMGLSNTT